MVERAPIVPSQPTWACLALSAGSAALGWCALAIDFALYVVQFPASAMGFGERLFIYLRTFTVETNAAWAILASVTALRAAGGRDLPAAAGYRALLAYLVVAGSTYELLLRRLWSPHGLAFVADLIFHDVQPMLTLSVWLLYAPKRSLSWRGIPWLLAYPALYFALAEAAGALGAGYPYPFLDAGRLGAPPVLAVAATFLAAFLTLALLITGAARVLTGGRTPAASPRC